MAFTYQSIAHPPQLLTQVVAGTTTIATATCTEVTYTVTGLDTPMMVHVTMSPAPGQSVPANIGVVNAYVSAANTLKVRFVNPTGSGIALTNNILLNVIAF